MFRPILESQVTRIEIGSWLRDLRVSLKNGTWCQQGQGVIAVEEFHNLIEQGWRIDSESSDYIFLVKGQRVNHLLHFLVGLFTIGVWWMVWIFIAAYGGEERRTVKKSSQ